MVRLLKSEREKLIKESLSLTETRSIDMTDDIIQSIEGNKKRVGEIDKEITQIMEDRNNQGKPMAEKTEFNEKREYTEYLRGTISQKEFEKRMTLAGVAGKAKELVPSDFLKELQETQKAYGKVQSKVRTITTGYNGELQIPIVDDTKNSGVWTDEAGAIDVKDIETKTILMNSYKVATGITLSTEMLEDSAFELSSYLAKALGIRLARSIENAIIAGDGSKKPQGILTDTATVAATGTGKVIADLEGMISQLDPSKREGAEFIVSDENMTLLRQAKDTQDRPLLQPLAMSTDAKDAVFAIWGYPVSVNYELEGGAGKDSAIFGNFKNYFLRNVRNVTLKRDDYSGMNKDLVSFYVTARLDGKPVSATPAFVKLTNKA